MDLTLDILHPEISLRNVEDVLNTYVQKNGFGDIPPSTDRKVEINDGPIFVDSGGFMADIFRISLTIKSKTGNKPDHNSTVILKAVTVRNFVDRKSSINDDDSVDIEVMNRLKKILSRMDASEALFYKRVAPLFAANSHKLCFRLPVCYYSQPCSSPNSVDGFLLLEDLDDGHHGTISLVQGLSKSQVEAAIDSIAQFHALSLVAPDDIRSLYPLREDLYFDHKKYHIVKIFGELPDTDYFKRNEAAFQAMFDRHSRPFAETCGLKPVLCHNDYWHSNIFFEKSSSGQFTSKLTRIIDFQNAQFSSGVLDVTRLVFCGTEPELRRMYLDDWLELYARSFYAAAEHLAPRVPVGANGEHLSEQKVIECVRAAYEFHRHFEMCFMVFLYFGNIAKLPVGDSRRVTLVQRCAQAFDDLKNNYDDAI